MDGTTTALKDIKSLESEQESLRTSVRREDIAEWQIERLMYSDPDGLEPFSAYRQLRFIGGLDLSCPKTNQSRACGALVIVSLPTLQVEFQDFLMDDVNVPYVPGFLGAREYPLMEKLLARARDVAMNVFPQVLLVDGNGVLHPRRCGSACYVGLKSGIPTIGVAKNLLNLDGWPPRLEKLVQDSIRAQYDTYDLVSDGDLVGKAMAASPNSLKPIYVSVGHNISLDTAVWVVGRCAIYRIPEPIRQADLYSRQLSSVGRAACRFKNLEPKALRFAASLIPQSSAIVYNDNVFETIQ